MKRTAIPITIIAILLLVEAILQSAVPVIAHTGVLAMEYSVQTGIVAGGDYQLTSLTCRSSGVAFGGNYRLLNRASSQLLSSGCCCTYLPVITQ